MYNSARSVCFCTPLLNKAKRPQARQSPQLPSLSVTAALDDISLSRDPMVNMHEIFRRLDNAVLLTSGREVSRWHHVQELTSECNQRLQQGAPVCFSLASGNSSNMRNICLISFSADIKYYVIFMR